MSYAEDLQKLKDSGSLRSFHDFSMAGGCYLQRNGRRLLNLCSNDYLGLGGDEALLRSFQEQMLTSSLADVGFASSSSRLLTGNCSVADNFEELLAHEYGTESALLFNSGYHANIGILPALAGKGDLVLSDKLNHASIHDGLALCRAEHRRFRHGDYEHLRTLLLKYRSQYARVFIVSESVFSMDGDLADLAALVALKHEFSCYLYLDEAHALGVRGGRGLGYAEECGLIAEVDLLVGTFGKALASVGAYLVCSQELRDYLINRSRSLIFTTALPPVQHSWNMYVFKQMLGMQEQRLYLQKLSDELRCQLLAAGFKTGGSSNIVPVIIGGSARTVDLAAALEEQGVLLLPIRPPTVPKGTSRFRISLLASMTEADLAPLVPTLAALI